jgi:NTP pyrophosphatase (non-canonical NTP hydrolase)
MRSDQREVLSISIRTLLSDAELLAQLAEEASELAHAALKLRRVRDGKNYTPVTFQEAYDQLKEEVSDVMLCLEVLGVDGDRRTMEVKLERWADRLRKHGGAGHV